MKKLNHEFKKIIFTIDCDYEELVDGIGLDYSRSGSDLKITQFIESENLKDYYDDNPENFCANVLRKLNLLIFLSAPTFTTPSYLLLFFDKNLDN